MWFFQFTQRSAVPGSGGPVERQPAGGDVAPPATSSPTHAGIDPFARDDPQGSPNLERFPATVEEMHYASRVFHDPSDFASARVLRVLSGSASRSAALLRLVRREADAAGVLERIRP